MVQLKSLFVALATVVAVVAGPCKPITTNTAADTTTAVLESSTTQTSIAQETSTITADDTTTAAPTTTTIEAAVTTTTTEAEATTSAATRPPQCGITGQIAEGGSLSFIHTPGKQDSAGACLEACGDYTGCDVVSFYTDRSSPNDVGKCDFFRGTLETDGSQTIYDWYEVACLAA
ncbi:hypothetical protein FHETE_863 [Fusarium heterosporum]|uniref:Apple domain-containing protein n=1 Tax=Fusarium heterosporum TaxID=42747 RepID=A0A8H5U055_FUSHE|nr:hypothetical protein FHETE_863 [Fusarium heterosporum]